MLSPHHQCVPRNRDEPLHRPPKAADGGHNGPVGVRGHRTGWPCQQPRATSDRQAETPSGQLTGQLGRWRPGDTPSKTALHKACQPGPGRPSSADCSLQRSEAPCLHSDHHWFSLAHSLVLFLFCQTCVMVKVILTQHELITSVTKILIDFFNSKY